MHEMKLGYKPRIFTFLNIWQDIGEPSKMLSDGFVCELAGGGGGGVATGSLSRIPGFYPPNASIRPSILVTTADFYRFPKVGSNRGTGSGSGKSVSDRGARCLGWHFAGLREGG